MSGDAERALEHAQAALATEPDRRRGAGRRPRRGAGARRPRRARTATPACCAASATATGPRAGPSADPADDDTSSRPSRTSSRCRPGFTELDPEGLIEEDRPRVTLADVGGLDEVKARLDAAFLAPLRNPELRAYYGKSLRGGLLLYGPPGCGKTFIARAVAGELGASFFALGLNDVLDMWLGESERKLHDAFAGGAPRRAVRALPRRARRARPEAQPPAPLRRAQRRQPVARRSSTARRPTTRASSCWPRPTTRGTSTPRCAGPAGSTARVLVLPPDQPAREAILRKALEDAPDRGRRRAPSSRAAPTAAPAPTSSTSSSPPPSPRCRSRSRPARMHPASAFSC